MTQYVYKQTEDHLYTVGFYDPNGKFIPDSDWGLREEAAQRVHYLNGGVTVEPEPRVPRMTRGGFYCDQTEMMISNPTIDSQGLGPAYPVRDYGFSYWNTGGNCSAYGLKCSNGYILLTDLEGSSPPDLDREGSMFRVVGFNDKDQQLWSRTMLVGRLSHTAVSVSNMAEDALNRAVYGIQTKLGVPTGDMAGRFFSGDEGEDIRQIFTEYIWAELREYPDEDF